MQRTVLITLIICMLVSHSSAQNTGQSDLSKQASKQDAAVGDEAKDAGDAEGDQKPSAPVAIAMKGSPAIDGKVDEVWEKADSVSVHRPVEDLTTLSKDQMATAQVKFLWDKQHLYALWVVKDSHLSVDHNDDWEQDSVELFLDRNLKRTVFYQYDDAQYRMNYEGHASGQGEGFVWDDLQGASAKTRTGYVVEMSILIPGGVLESGLQMGIEMQVNDNRGGQGRESVTKWNHTEDDSWEDTSNFGTLRLK